MDYITFEKREPSNEILSFISYLGHGNFHSNRKVTKIVTNIKKSKLIMSSRR